MDAIVAVFRGVTCGLLHVVYSVTPTQCGQCAKWSALTECGIGSEGRGWFLVYTELRYAYKHAVCHSAHFLLILHVSTLVQFVATNLEANVAKNIKKNNLHHGKTSVLG